MRKLGWMLLASFLVFNACKESKMTFHTEESSEKAIISFIFSELSPEVNGTINNDEKTIIAEVPSDVDISSLKPVLSISETASVTPASSETIDFSNAVNYTVTAEDGSTVVYKVTVTKASSLIIDPITSSTIIERGGMFIITGSNFIEGSMKVYLFNDSKEYEMQISTVSSESITFLTIHEMDLGNYELKLSDGTNEVVADKEFTIEIESPKVSSISKTEVIQGEGFTITGEYFSATKENNSVLNLFLFKLGFRCSQFAEYAYIPGFRAI